MNAEELFALISAIQEDKEATMAKMAKELSAFIHEELTDVLEGHLPSGENWHQLEWDQRNINYSHYCHDVMGWPDLQDGGVFEQCVEQAIVRACLIYAIDHGYKPMAIVKELEWAERFIK